MAEPRPIPFVPRSQADALALEIAQAFNDEKRLLWYRRLCQQHGHSVVYRAYKAALAVPSWRITKSRIALFLFLLKPHGRR